MGFSLEWLALREPADREARNTDLRHEAARLAGHHPIVMDLGCGAGSTVRALADVLPEDTVWRLVDNDSALLDTAQTLVGPGSTTHLANINEVSALPFEGVTLVTASALLDLVTEDWVRRLAAVLRVPFYAALSYNGQMRWDPPLPDDQSITEAFNRHQLQDKGLGPALGPESVETTQRVFESVGATVTVAPSPWQVGPEQSALHEALVRGIAEAAFDMGEPSALDWGKARVAAASTTQCTIGHDDILVVPPHLPEVDQ